MHEMPCADGSFGILHRLLWMDSRQILHARGQAIMFLFVIYYHEPQVDMTADMYTAKCKFL